MPEMASVARYYTVLVDYVDRAIEALNQNNHIKARELLIKGLRDAEEVYIGMTCDNDFSES